MVNSVSPGPAPNTDPGAPGPWESAGGRASTRPARPARLILALLLLATLLFAFNYLNTAGVRSRHESACASILAVVNPEGSTFERQGASGSDNHVTVRLLYAVNLPDGHVKRTVILCAFDADTGYSSAPRLIAVTLNGQSLGPARLAFLNRFWLPSEEAAADLPSGTPQQAPSKTGADRNRQSG